MVEEFSPIPLALNFLQEDAERLVKDFQLGIPLARRRITDSSIKSVRHALFSIEVSQELIAEEYGFADWATLLSAAADLVPTRQRRVASLAKLACTETGEPQRAARILRANPGLAGDDFLAAVISGNAAVVKQALTDEPDRASEVLTGRSPILHLCFSCFWEQSERRDELSQVLKLLLQNGADPKDQLIIEPSSDSSPPTRRSCLYAAAVIHRQAGLARQLLAAGADPNDGNAPCDDVAQSRCFDTLYRVARTDDQACLEAILEAEPTADTVSFCLAGKLAIDDHEGTRRMLEAGADPNHIPRVESGDSNLHIAVRERRRAETIRLLLDFGGDETQTNTDGHTPLDLAVRFGHEAAAQALVERGASDREDAYDWALGCICVGDQQALERIADESPEVLPRLVAEDSATLPYMARFGKLEAVRLLVQIGIPISTRDDTGMTALHWAALGGHSEMLRLLLSLGASTEQTDGAGRTAIELCLQAPNRQRYEIRPGGEAMPSTAVDHQESHRLLVEASGAAGVLPSVGASASAKQPSLDRAEQSVKLFHVFSNLPTNSLQERLGAMADQLRRSFAEGRHAAERFVERLRSEQDPNGERTLSNLSYDESRQLIAQFFAFENWDELERMTPVKWSFDFDEAVEAVVTGNVTRLREMLEDIPWLVFVRSPYGHRATLLHYLAGRGLESHQVRSSTGRLETARILLSAGAKLNATCLDPLSRRRLTVKQLLLQTADFSEEERGALLRLFEQSDHSTETNDLPEL